MHACLLPSGHAPAQCSVKVVIHYFCRVIQLTSDWLGAELTLLGEQLSEARHAVRLVIVRCELVIGQDLGTVRAAETLTMPRRLVVCHAALRYRLYQQTDTVTDRWSDTWLTDHGFT